MVTIDSGKCTACGTCVAICHEHCMRFADRKLEINHGHCSTCGQCIAICPQTALSWNHQPPAPFNDRFFPSAAQVDELIQRRRTIRKFKRQKPDRRLVEEVVACGDYAPVHAHHFRYVILDDDQLLQAVDTAVFTFVKNIHRWLFKPRWIETIIRILAPYYLGEYLKAKPKLEAAVQDGRGYRQMPPDVVFIIGDKRDPLSLESAQYMAGNITLGADARGLGCRLLVGNQMIYNRNRRVREILGMNKHEVIFATLGIGYPGLEFQNKLRGKHYPLRWNSEQKK